MIRSERLPGFLKDLKRLGKRYASLPDDLARFERIVALAPKSPSMHRAVLYASPTCVIVKSRLACATLRGSTLRIIYAWHPESETLVLLELYFKGDKETEDTGRIRLYLRALKRR